MELIAMNASTGKKRSLILLVLTLAVVVLAALASSRFHFGIDLTADRSYSLSAISRKQARELPDRLRLTYYVSPDVSARYAGARQIEDFLGKYPAASRGKISVSVADPSREAKTLEGLGLSAKRMQVIVSNEPRMVTVYSGILVQYHDRTEVLPFVLGPEGLEYDLYKAIGRALSGKQDVAAVLVGDADRNYRSDYQGLDQALRASGWQVEEIQPGQAVPAEARVLLVLGNGDLDDYDSYQIDSYLASGGSAFMALRGVGIEIGYGLTASPLRQDALIKAMASYGLKLDKSLLLDPNSRTSPFSQGVASDSLLLYPHWVVVSAADADRKNPVTAHFSGLDLMWPSPLELSAPRGVDAKLLVKSSGKAYLQTKSFAVGPDESALYDSEADSTTRQYGLAASLSGILPMAYAGKPVPAKQGAPALVPLPQAAKASKLFVVSSADFLMDQCMQVQDLRTQTDAMYNAGFASRAVEWLAYGDDLVNLKAQGSRDPRLVKVQDPGRRILLELLAIGANILVIPGGFALFGILKSRKRKAAAKAEAMAANAPETQAGTAPGEGKEGGKQS
jgi:ABC-type uncharacterized transport system involved in gliding motility auxiliary subunit